MPQGAQLKTKTEPTLTTDKQLRRYQDVSEMLPDAENPTPLALEGCDVAGAAAFLDFAADADVQLFV